MKFIERIRLMKQIDFREVPDDFWTLVAPLLEPFKRNRSGGRPPLPQRNVLAGIIYKCRTGCQWAMLPACYGSKSAIHEHFQRWNTGGVLARIFQLFLEKYGIKLDTTWQAMDGSLVQAPVRTKKISG